jgi:hypothetical protein
MGVAIKFVLCLVTFSVQCDFLQTIKIIPPEVRAFLAGGATVIACDVARYRIGATNGEDKGMRPWSPDFKVYAAAGSALIAITWLGNSSDRRNIKEMMMQGQWVTTGGLIYLAFRLLAAHNGAE